MPKRILDNDIVKLFDAETGKKLAATLFWGDEVEEVGPGPVFQIFRNEFDPQQGFKLVPQLVVPKKNKKLRFREEPLLKVRFVDVGQGDATMIETPGGERILLDGGEGPWIRRYLRTAFAHLLKDGPIDLAAIVVSHGDADHFAGLTELVEHESGGKRLVKTELVLHNGLAKGSAERDVEVFGETVKVDGKTYVTDLVGDLREVPDERLNEPFREWKEALRSLGDDVGDLAIRRTFYDDDPFAFIDSAKIEVVGPIVEKVDGKDALPFLKTPGSSSLSASHTVNGHSIVLRLTRGNVRFLFGADLNEESEEALVERAQRDGRSLEAEVLKVPHHGSADFSPRMLEKVRAVVSVVSSGDENASKEFFHPRAGLVGALGKYSRSSVERPLVYVTEMVAFFRRIPNATEQLAKADAEGNRERKILNPYEKLAFGIVHVRTDGERTLVATHGGRGDQKESYVFRTDPLGNIVFEEPSIL